ncbi:Dehydrogenase/reductase SDR family member on chromosome X [Linum grandiflorum]
MKEIGGTLRFICSTEFWTMGLFWTVSLLVSYCQLFLRRITGREESYPRSDPPQNSPTPPVCIVTGATSGLGAAAASALSKQGFYVVLVGLSSELLSEVLASIGVWQAMKEIRTQNKEAKLKGFVVDLTSFQSILEFKSSLEKWLLDSDMHSSIQLLINNAGILATCLRPTTEGYDQMMGTNYTGAFFLTKTILPLLKNSPSGSRIVNVTSFTHRAGINFKLSCKVCAQFNEETVTGKCFFRSREYPYARVYQYSKLCLLLFTYELHRQLKLEEGSNQVSVIAADPGIVKTNIMREVPLSLSHVTFLVFKVLGLLQSPEDGINSILDASFAPSHVSGVYFFGGKGRTLKSSVLSYDTVVAEKLWSISCDLHFKLKLASRASSSSS